MARRGAANCPRVIETYVFFQRKCAVPPQTSSRSAATCTDDRKYADTNPAQNEKAEESEALEQGMPPEWGGPGWAKVPLGAGRPEMARESTVMKRIC